MKSIFPFIHFIPSVWCFGQKSGQGGGVCLFMYVLMFNSRLQYLPPSRFFPSSLLRLSQPKPEWDSCNKSQKGPRSNQHHSRTAWESMRASSGLDNTLSCYQTCSVMPHNVWWRHRGSDRVSWEWHDLNRLFQCTQRASIKAARSLRHQPHGFDLQWVVAALNQVPSIHGTIHFITAGVR